MSKTYRPYSKLELVDIDAEINKKFKIGDVIASHYTCQHKYRVKRGGKKELSVLDSVDGYLPAFMCSVCYKLRTSNEKIDADIERIMCDAECTRPKDFILDVDILRQKEQFYKWLYAHDDY